MGLQVSLCWDAIFLSRQASPGLGTPLCKTGNSLQVKDLLILTLKALCHTGGKMSRRRQRTVLEVPQGICYLSWRQ